MEVSVIQQVLNLQDQKTPELRELWSSLFGQAPPRCTRAYMIPRLAHRLQELAYGPMPDRSAKHLDQLADQMEKGKKFSSPITSARPRCGTKLIREFNGVIHEVLVQENSFQYLDQSYKSLSAIARHITGTRWNGPAFFGLRSRKQGT